MAIDVKPDPKSPTFRKKSPSSLLRAKQAKARWAKHDQSRKHSARTEAEKRHEALFRKWVANMNRQTFADFILSAYC